MVVGHQPTSKDLWHDAEASILHAVYRGVEQGHGIKLGCPQSFTIKWHEIPDNAIPIDILTIWFPRLGAWGLRDTAAALPAQ